MENNPDYNKSNHTQQMCDGILDDANDLMLQVTGEKERLSEETDFPLEVFPAPMRDVVIEMWRGLSYPVDFTAGAMLAAVAMCTGSTVRAKFKTGWVSFCNMFVAVVGCPGANKTNPLKAILAPLFEYDSLLDEKNREKVRVYRETLAIPAKHREEMGLPLCPEEPIIEQLVVQDVTQEAIKKVLSHNLYVCNYEILWRVARNSEVSFATRCRIGEFYSLTKIAIYYNMIYPRLLQFSDGDKVFLS